LSRQGPVRHAQALARFVIAGAAMSKERMNEKTVWAIAAFSVAFLATGIPYWQIPYAKVSLPSSLYGPALLVVAIAAAALRLGAKASFARALFVAGLAVPAMVMARVQVETSLDPTSHNLWPLEIIIAAAVGLLVSFAGSLIGGLLVLAFGNRDTD